MVKRSRNRKRKVALFIDVANVCELDMDWILRAARRQGQVEVARGYGSFTNWRYLAPAAERLFLKGVRLTHCPAWRNASGEWKDCADEIMIDDIYRTLEERPEIERFIICTGDGHFVPVTMRICGSGREAVVIAPPHGISRMLQEVASRCLTAPYSKITLPLGDFVGSSDNCGRNSQGARQSLVQAEGPNRHELRGVPTRPSRRPPLTKPGLPAA